MAGKEKKSINAKNILLICKFIKSETQTKSVSITNFCELKTCDGSTFKSLRMIFKQALFVEMTTSE